MTQCHMTTCHNNCCHLSFELKGEMTMPTDTFFHLPLDKQKRILSAAKKEFSRVPLKDASIANIIKDAEIPRGSFYQYFENKEDLYYYYFHTLKKNSQRDLIRSIQHEKGDLFAGFEWYFSRMIEEVLEGKKCKILSQSLHEYGLSFFAKSDAGYPQKTTLRLSQRASRSETEVGRRIFC